MTLTWAFNSPNITNMQCGLDLYEYAIMHVQLSQRVVFQYLKQILESHFPSFASK